MKEGIEKQAINTLLEKHLKGQTRSNFIRNEVSSIEMAKMINTIYEDMDNSISALSFIDDLFFDEDSEEIRPCVLINPELYILKTYLYSIHKLPDEAYSIHRIDKEYYDAILFLASIFYDKNNRYLKNKLLISEEKMKKISLESKKSFQEKVRDIDISYLSKALDLLILGTALDFSHSYFEPSIDYILDDKSSLKLTREKDEWIKSPDSLTRSIGDLVLKNTLLKGSSKEATMGHLSESFCIGLGRSREIRELMLEALYYKKVFQDIEKDGLNSNNYQSKNSFEEIFKEYSNEYECLTGYPLPDKTKFQNNLLNTSLLLMEAREDFMYFSEKYILETYKDCK